MQQLLPWQFHPRLAALRNPLQVSADCWTLLTASDGTSRKERYLPKGEREPETAYRKRLDAARPSGFFRDALRTYAGMLSRGSWISLPTSLGSVLTDVDGRGTDLGVFLAAADLLVLRDRYVLRRLAMACGAAKAIVRYKGLKPQVDSPCQERFESILRNAGAYLDQISTKSHYSPHGRKYAALGTLPWLRRQSFGERHASWKE